MQYLQVWLGSEFSVDFKEENLDALLDDSNKGKIVHVSDQNTGYDIYVNRDQIKYIKIVGDKASIKG